MSNEYEDEKIEKSEPDWEQKKVDIEKEYVHLQANMHKNTSMNLDREIQQRMYNKFDTDEAIRCLRWIYEVTGIFPPKGGFWSALRDGFLLSRLLIALHPPYGEKWNPRPIKANSAAAFKARSQLTEFIKRAQQYGAASTITVDNLYEGTNLSQVLSLIGALNKEAVKREFAGPKMIPQTGRKRGTIAKRVNRPSMTGFDLEQSLYRSESEEADLHRNMRISQTQYREGDKIDFLLLHSKDYLYEWVPGTILKSLRNTTSSLGVPEDREFSVIATDTETYGLEPDQAIKISSNYIRPRCKETYQLISSSMETNPEGSNENKIVPIVQELIETEETYLGGLRDIVIKYYDGLFGEGDKRILPDAFKSKILYYDLDTFFTMHRRLYLSLKRARSIPGVIVANCDWLKMYCRFSNNYEKLLAEIRELRKNREVHNRWLETEKKAQNIESLLITPIQRIPRYELLLDKMLKYISKNHPQRITLKFAKAKITTIAQKLNDAKDKIEKSTRFMAALEMITDVPSGVELWASDRYFIKEHEFRRKSTSMYYTVKPCRLLLFNDILVYTEKSGKFRQMLPLLSITLVRPFCKENMKEGACAINIEVKEEKEDQSVEVFAKDELVQSEWIKLITDQINICSSLKFTTRSYVENSVNSTEFLRNMVISRTTI